MPEHDKKIPLVEMFGPTIQGEGAVIGQQTYFMRFGLCDYKCTMCDSMNAVDPQQVRANAQWLTEGEIADKFILEKWKTDSTRWITLSGGNPCIHDLSALVSGLGKLGFKFAVETQGTKCPEWLANCEIVTCSPKGPGMGEETDFEVLDKFIDPLKYHVGLNFKVVLFDQRDLEFAKMIYERYQQYEVPFYLSLGNPFPPGDHRPNVKMSHQEHMSALVSQYRVILEDVFTDPILSQMRFLPQWHVFVWGNEKGK